MGQRGAMWWGGWIVAFVFLCLYIAFEVMDLDGSQFRVWSGVALTVESASAEADRALRTCADSLGIRLQPYMLPPSTVRPVRLAMMPLRSFRGGRPLARRQLSRIGRITLAADPA